MVSDIKHTPGTLLAFRLWNSWCRRVGYIRTGPEGRVGVTITTCWLCRVLARAIDWAVRTEEL